MKNLGLLFVASLFILSCQNQSVSKWNTIKFVTGQSAWVHLNLGDSAHGHGDGTAFEAPLMDTSGVEVGELLGWLVTVDILDGDSINPVFDTERIGTMVFNLGDENEIIAQGGMTYHKGEKQPKLGLAQKRVVVGGTGKYKGIKGEVTTTRNEDGSYLHVLDVKQD
jgi:hypothetical protein